MYFVYIIHSKSSHKYYTGLTCDIDRRLNEHNSKRSSVQFTKKENDFKLIFCQVCNNRIEARTLERYLKSGAGREIREDIVK